MYKQRSEILSEKASNTKWREHNLIYYHPKPREGRSLVGSLKSPMQIKEELPRSNKYTLPIRSACFEKVSTPEFVIKVINIVFPKNINFVDLFDICTFRQSQKGIY